VTGKELPVTIFTDANAAEINRLLSIGNITVAANHADIVDILLLSRSKICILSISSTFSFWAGFLSNGIVLKHPDEWHPELRPVTINSVHYEGVPDKKTNALITQLHAIANEQ
jgi:hypothetical protein